MRDPKSEASPFVTGSQKTPQADYYGVPLNFTVAEHVRSTSYKYFDRFCQLPFLGAGAGDDSRTLTGSSQKPTEGGVSSFGEGLRTIGVRSFAL
jgi:hypothetical protein